MMSRESDLNIWMHALGEKKKKKRDLKVQRRRKKLLKRFE